jgi:ATP-dependent Clp protease ATP-binding subunit ClpX
MIPEIMGRLPVITATEDLGVNELTRILTEPKNALVKQFQKQFFMDGVELEFTPGALKAVAEKSLENHTNARGLRSILEEALEQAKFDVPGNKRVKKIVVDADTINNGTPPQYINHGFNLDEIAMVTIANDSKPKLAAG